MKADVKAVELWFSLGQTMVLCWYAGSAVSGNYDYY